MSPGIENSGLGSRHPVVPGRAVRPGTRTGAPRLSVVWAVRPSWLSRDVLAGWRESPAPSPPVSSGWPDYGERAGAAGLFLVWLHLTARWGKSNFLSLGAGCRVWWGGSLSGEMLVLTQAFHWYRGAGVALEGCLLWKADWVEGVLRNMGWGRRCWWVRWRLLVLAPENAQPAILMEGNKNRACQSLLPWRKFLPISTAPERVPR